MELPDDVVSIIRDYSRPITRPNWRFLHLPIPQLLTVRFETIKEQMREEIRALKAQIEEERNNTQSILDEIEKINIDPI